PGRPRCLLIATGAYFNNPQFTYPDGCSSHTTIRQQVERAFWFLPGDGYQGLSFIGGASPSQYCYADPVIGYDCPGLVYLPLQSTPTATWTNEPPPATNTPTTPPTETPTATVTATLTEAPTLTLIPTATLLPMPASHSLSNQYRIFIAPVTGAAYNLFWSAVYDTSIANCLIQNGETSWWPLGHPGFERWASSQAACSLFPDPDETAPHTDVSWYEAHSYCAWFAKQLHLTAGRLPLQTEWDEAKPNLDLSYKEGEADRFEWLEPTSIPTDFLYPITGGAPISGRVNTENAVFRCVISNN
ncbi:MAG TPA: SUMF1/EgtB/PvdO family nonheme iron enzyme, partial [Phototrophicaceae bacterium]|nr:SUMF1/EgtB/PvdO family nonheme iron enzyme [Phototrophicaceae bacterium]